MAEPAAKEDTPTKEQLNEDVRIARENFIVRPRNALAWASLVAAVIAAYKAGIL